jgi:uncharacterized Zn finger protein
MAEFSRTWWGKRFIEALEGFTDSARLGRGRSYARNGKILDYTIFENQIIATVKGSVNPYFGVYKEPRYHTSIEITPISEKNWKKIIQSLSSKASFVAKLLMNEVPDNIDDAFADLGLPLIPQNQKDFHTNCSCPDWENPCKHIAGVYYLVASQLDENPFLLFELRGLSKEALQDQLAKSPLGQILSQEMGVKAEVPLTSVSSYFPPLEKETVDENIDLKEFWLGTKRFSQTAEVASPAIIPAILVKKQGDFPAFWKKDNSFIEAMEELYERVKTKNREVL